LVLAAALIFFIISHIGMKAVWLLVPVQLDVSTFQAAQNIRDVISFAKASD
jgi:hypothetical protein